MVETRFGTEIKDAKLRILAMAGLVEQAIEHGARALTDQGQTPIESVAMLEAKINQDHKDIDELCLGVLARLAPVASDLRLVIAIVKINTDLERMGDQALNLAKNIGHYIGHPPLDIAREFTRMAALVQVMVREALDAFVNDDVELANKVLSSDDAVDAFKRQLTAQLTQIMKTEKSNIEAALNLTLIARNLERIADHATNIAEEVIFIRTGDDIRHGGAKLKKPE